MTNEEKFNLEIDIVDENGQVIDSLNISETTTIQTEEENKGFLIPKLCHDFREAINSSAVFIESEKHKHRYNLTCAVMDRIDSAIKVLNSFEESPKTEESFVYFLVYACMIKDGIYKLYENVFHQKPPCIDDKKCFYNASDYSSGIFTEETCPTDDVFFEYFRSITFAHPFETSKGWRKERSFMDDGEIQCSPWVISGRSNRFNPLTDSVGVRLYSNRYERDLKDIFISFDKLKDYIKIRYEYLIELTSWAKNEVVVQDSEWRQTKVKREDDEIKTLWNVKKILEERFQDTYEIDDLIAYLSCTNSIPSNEKNVRIYKNVIINIVPLICDCVDELNYEKLYEVISIAYKQPKETHQMFHYQMEKIFCYLKEKSAVIEIGSNEEWGLIQADNFSKEFAKNWVIINAYQMSYDEIKLLVRTACYLEWREQEEKAN